MNISIIDAVSWVLLLGGSFFSIVGGLGALRFPDVFTRLHASGMVDTMGAALILAGLVLQGGASLVSVKILLVLVFLWVTSPVSTHAVARAALKAGIKPVTGERGDS